MYVSRTIVKFRLQVKAITSPTFPQLGLGLPFVYTPLSATLPATPTGLNPMPNYFSQSIER